jgi:hypothetical protein
LTFWIEPIIFVDMEKPIRKLTRRELIKMGVLGAGALILRPAFGLISQKAEWPTADLLGRVCVEQVKIRQRPTAGSLSVGELYYDDIVVWIREVVGDVPQYRISSRWVETPAGYVYAPNLQAVKNIPNPPVTQFPTDGPGSGMWVEVTTPFVDVKLENYPAIGYWLQENYEPRLYYSQVIWADQIKTGEDGKLYYRINEKYDRGDLYWGAAEAFRPITLDELAPITPEIEDKKIVVNLFQDTLSCFEGKLEVYFCKISAGLPFDAKGNPVPVSATPLGSHPIWRKLISTHMEGGSAGGGFDLPGVAWTCLFAGTGEAIHSTFWHNDFGAKRSHGCVNASPEDAKWIFRWTTPAVEYDPGEMTVSMPGGTKIEVIEGG